MFRARPSFEAVSSNVFVHVLFKQCVDVAARPSNKLFFFSKFVSNTFLNP